MSIRGRPGTKAPPPRPLSIDVEGFEEGARASNRELASKSEQVCVNGHENAAFDDLS